MKKNLGAAPLVFPQPVLIIATYDENEKANSALNIFCQFCQPVHIILFNISKYSYYHCSRACLHYSDAHHRNVHVHDGNSVHLDCNLTVR